MAFWEFLPARFRKHRAGKSNDEAWPSIVLGDDEKLAGYVHSDNIKLVMSLTQEGLKSQIDGVRQMFTRLGTVLTQASTLANTSFAITAWLVTHPVVDRPAWFTWIFGVAGTFWSISGALAVAGMAGAKFGAPGINPRDGYKQDVLSQGVRDMQLWAIESLAVTLADGEEASDEVRRHLNSALMLLVGAPLFSLVLVAVGSLLF